MTQPMTRPTDTSSRSCCADDCCGPTSGSWAAETAVGDADTVREHVREGYGRIARGQSASCGCSGDGTSATSSCCGSAAGAAGELAAAIGYSAQELASTPPEANMGLSCGNPTALAALRPGEIVLDLGAGGGFDCFVAGPKVGPAGRVIGVDMTADMVDRARRNVASYRRHSGLDNVEFRLGEIESLPVADASVDVVISNCVINLSPDKPRVWREIARVLRPGGRAAISDLALLKPLPEAVRRDVEALVGCIAGAVLVEESVRLAADAGLQEIVATPRRRDFDALGDLQDPLYRRILGSLPKGARLGDYVTSLDLSARRPR